MTDNDPPDYQTVLETLKEKGPPLFSLGYCAATPAALALLERLNLAASTFLELHQHGSWGQLDAQDSASNDAAVTNGERILSTYTLNDVDRIWVMTEAVSKYGKRKYTMMLLPNEY